ncbi:MAG: tRNA pseudouridine(38-40) synthase TruA [Actinobacteria bacterium]|nr:tRNA pseudouridine(38-40) synthase TruA [Actinomycetota bacterium]MCI0545098.1 tRNA pseudouridine(38-40) synthase TruA [Actinomycetota bacterium]MCI0677557.1 tRNA pseudouridine(38-40) synthase TruA [Actinomycetota bacterium]
MPTVRLDLGYDGSGFHGYAKQEGLRTVQGELETALGRVLGGSPETAVAGRTDAGVHARGQVVSFAAGPTLDTEQLLRALNGMLGPEIAVTRAAMVDNGFHARHSAVWRRYRYRLGTRPGGDPLTRGYTWDVGRDLDREAMELAAAVFLGEHDFSSFCRGGGSSVRQVEESRLIAEDEGVLVYWVRANAFCHQMVRSLVGHLYDVGRGFASADDAGMVLGAGDRSLVVTVAPPHGLTLWEVGY